MYLYKVMVVVTVSTWETWTQSLKNSEAICLPAPWKVLSPYYRLRLSPYANLQNGTAVNYGTPCQLSHGQLKWL